MGTLSSPTPPGDCPLPCLHDPYAHRYPPLNDLPILLSPLPSHALCTPSTPLQHPFNTPPSTLPHPPIHLCSTGSLFFIPPLFAPACPDPQSPHLQTSFLSLRCPCSGLLSTKATSAVHGIECQITSRLFIIVVAQSLCNSCRTTEGVVRLLVERLVDQKKLVSARQAMCRISVSLRGTQLLALDSTVCVTCPRYSSTVLHCLLMVCPDACS